MIPSALFFTDDSPVPSGIRARDIGSMVQGFVDEHSPVPIEQTSWGFLLDSRSKKQSHIFYYAAPKELVFQQSTDASDLSMAAVLPGFAALHGLQFRKSSWIFLLEEECLTAALYENNSPIPSRVHARFLDKAEADPTLTAHELRTDLVRRLVDQENEHVVEGLIRVAQKSDGGSKGITFRLEQQEQPDRAWLAWKKTELRNATRLKAADLREHAALEAQSQRKSSGQKLLQVAACILILIATLAFFEFRQDQQQREVERLSMIAREQAPLVERLQEIEAMNKSLQKVFQKNFTPYRWLMEMNAPRPETIALLNFAIDASGKISTSGIGPEIKALNEYVASLQENVKFQSVEIVKIDTNKDGVSFNLSLETGDITAEPEPEPEATAESEATTEGASSEEEGSRS